MRSCTVIPVQDRKYIFLNHIYFFLLYSFRVSVCILQREDDPDIQDTPVVLLSVATENSTGNIQFNPNSICVVIEGDIVVRSLPRLADALLLLFGLTYALHLDYPKKLVYTFTFVQKILLCLDDNRPLKPCLLNLKNEFFSNVEGTCV